MLDRLDDWGLTEATGVDIYQNGQKYITGKDEKFIWDSNRSLALKVDDIDHGAVSIWEQRELPRSWIKVSGWGN